jgi:cystathionine gamma-synthase
MNNHFSTKAVHGGETKHKPYGSLTTPVVRSSTFTFADTAQILDFVERKERGEPPTRHEYGRYSNPTQDTVERKVAVLEGGERALLFSSGMNAITTAILALLEAGDHMLMLDGAYRRTQDFARDFLPRWGIESTFVPIDDVAALAAAIRPNTRLILAETPTNPYLRVADLPRIVALAREHSIATAIDSTFATPINLRPLEIGLDLVIHSATKYLGGHNDLLAGIVIGSGERMAKIEYARGVLGGVSNPNDGYLLLRGLKTLEIRLLRHNENGLRIAQFLEGHPAISRVHYPGLPSHPDYALARKLMTGFGSVVSFEVAGDVVTTGQVMDRLQLPYIGPTLGGVESIAQQQAIFISVDPEERERSGIADNLVRYSAGIEDAEDLIADLDQALSVVATNPNL